MDTKVVFCHTNKATCPSSALEARFATMRYINLHLHLTPTMGKDGQHFATNNFQWWAGYQLCCCFADIPRRKHWCDVFCVLARCVLVHCIWLDHLTPCWCPSYPQGRRRWTLIMDPHWSSCLTGKSKTIFSILDIIVLYCIHNIWNCWTVTCMVLLSCTHKIWKLLIA